MILILILKGENKIHVFEYKFYGDGSAPNIYRPTIVKPLSRGLLQMIMVATNQNHALSSRRKSICRFKSPDDACSLFATVFEVNLS